MNSFWNLLSGKIEYAIQWAAWMRLCKSYGVDGEAVLGLLNRAHAFEKSTKGVTK